MKRRPHTPEQIIHKQREAERLIGEGETIPEAAKETITGGATSTAG